MNETYMCQTTHYISMAIVANSMSYTYTPGYDSAA